MLAFKSLLVLFIVVPLIEIYFLVKVGGLIGALPTIVLVVFTAVLGTLLLRWQGLATIGRVQANLAAGQVPALEMMEGVVLVLCGVLLLTPGFFTDTLGFLCLITPLRRGLIMSVIGRFGATVRPAGTAAGGSADDKQGRSGAGPATLEGEYRREDDRPDR
ncbi:MAG: exlusion protein FxsA [Gammaproteobacteria bacterium]|nr:MAG: exlusion protein FxsA [Gammaproteobacteria bacterium]